MLLAHERVHEAVVVRRADARWGEVPCAFVELKPGAGDVTAEELIAFCRSNLAHFKCPRQVRFESLPKTATGKIQRRALREAAVAPAPDPEGR